MPPANAKIVFYESTCVTHHEPTVGDSSLLVVTIDPKAEVPYAPLSQQRLVLSVTAFRPVFSNTFRRWAEDDDVEELFRRTMIKVIFLRA